MIWHEKTLGWGVVVGLALLVVLAACSGSSAQSAEPEATAVVEAPTAEPTEEPVEPAATPEPVVVQDSDRVDAVVAALDASIEAGDAPEGLIAFDVLDSSVSEDGTVTLNICAWDGETVFDEVRDTLWQTDVNADGAISVTHVTTPVAAGECLNTHLIETALATLQEFDEYWIEMSADPGAFPTDPRTETLLGGLFREALAPMFASWSDEGLRLLHARPPEPIQDAILVDPLWRRIEGPTRAVIEVAICRDMIPERGLYREGVLVDDGRSPSSPGLHSIDSLQVVVVEGGGGKWFVVGRTALVWSDCLLPDGWRDGANAWQPRSELFEVLEW